MSKINTLNSNILKENKYEKLKGEPCWTGTTRSKEDQKCLLRQISLGKGKRHPNRRDRGCLARIGATCVPVFWGFLRLFGTHEGIGTLVSSSCSRLRFPSRVQWTNEWIARMKQQSTNDYYWGWNFQRCWRLLQRRFVALVLNPI